MKIKLKFCLVLVFAIACRLPLFAQNQQKPCSVVGAVIDDEKQAVSYASVAVWLEEKVIAGCVTDDKGRFSLTVPQSASAYDITFDFVGFPRKKLEFVADKVRVDLGFVDMVPSMQQLGEAEVVAKSVEKSVSVESTSLNVSATMAGEKGAVLDVLRSFPSVTIDANQNIFIRGNNNILVLFDGMPTSLTDLAAMPAANIKSIDMVTNPDASYDAEGTGGIINIIPKKNNVAGTSALVALNYGFNHFANGNVALNLNKEKTAWRFSINSKYEDDVIEGHLFRSFHADEKSTEQTVNSLATTFNANVNLGTTLRINSRNTLDVDVKFAMPRFNTLSDFSNTYHNDNQVINEKRSSDVTWNRENIDASIVYKHVLPQTRTEIFRASVSKIWGHRPSYYFLEGDSIGKSNSGGSPFIASLQYDCKMPLEFAVMDGGFKFTYRQNDIFHEFYNWENSGWLLSDVFSNDLLHREFVPAAYILFSSKGTKAFSYKFGLRLENSTVWLNSNKEAISQKNNNLFIAPSLNLNYQINERQAIGLVYGRRIGRPTYPQLNPYMSMIDNTTFEQGNMFLKPEHADNLEFAYSLKTNILSLNANLYGRHVGDYITQVTKLQDDILLLTYINCDSDFKTGLDFSIRVEPAGWIDFTLSANTFYSNTKANFEGLDLDNRGWSNSSNLLVNVNPLKGTSLQLQYFYLTPQYYPQFTTETNHYLNVGVKQKLAKGKLVLSAMLTDVFGTNAWRIHSENRIYDLTNSRMNKSRMFWIGVSYNINSFKSNKIAPKAESDRGMIRIGG